MILILRMSLIGTLLFFTQRSFSQVNDSAKNFSYFSGNVMITNNGISIFPSFTLNKPAVTFNRALGKRKLSFEPVFQFAWDGKPWTFLFWWRYKIIQTRRFFFRTGAHPALSFVSLPVQINGVSKETITVQRYLAGELVPEYLLKKNVSLGR